MVKWIREERWKEMELPCGQCQKEPEVLMPVDQLEIEDVWDPGVVVSC